MNLSPVMKDFIETSLVLLHSKLKNQVPEGVALDIITEAVEIEKDFVTNALPVSLLGMNASQMCEYIEFVADHLLATLGYATHYGTQNPFPWMEMISMQVRRTSSNDASENTKRPESPVKSLRSSQWMKTSKHHRIGQGRTYPRMSPSDYKPKRGVANLTLRHKHLWFVSHEFSKDGVRTHEVKSCYLQRDSNNILGSQRTSLCIGIEQIFQFGWRPSCSETKHKCFCW